MLVLIAVFHPILNYRFYSLNFSDAVTARVLIDPFYIHKITTVELKKKYNVITFEIYFKSQNVLRSNKNIKNVNKINSSLHSFDYFRSGKTQLYS